MLTDSTEPARDVLTPRRGSSPWQWLVLSLVLGVLLFFYLRYQPTKLAHYTDPLIYLAGAESIAEGQGYRLITHAGTPRIGCHPPLQAAYLALFWKLDPRFPENVAWLYAAMFLAAIVTFILFHCLATWHGVPALLASVLILAWGLAANWAPLLYGFMSDILFGALALGLVCYWARVKDPFSARAWLITGILAALLYLTRTAATAAVGVLAIVVSVHCWQRRRIVPLAAYLAPVAIAVLGWKMWAAGSPGYGAYIKYRVAEQGGWLALLRYNFDSALDYLSGLGLVRCVLGPWLDFPSHPLVAGSPLSAVLALFALLSCWIFTACWVAGWWRAESKVERVTGYVVLAYLAQLCIYPANLSDRVLFVVLPFTLIWAWKGFRLFSARWPRLRFTALAAGGLLLICVAANAVGFVHTTEHLNRCSPREELAEVGAWLRAHSPPDTVVAATLSQPTMHFYHYSGRRVIENYFAKQPGFSVADGSTNSGARASFVLLDWYSPLTPGDLRATLYLEKSSVGGKYRLYRVVDQ